jgi:predicted phage-related endonuclease
MEGSKMMDYNKMAMDNLNALMREIAEYTRMVEEVAATLDSLKDILKKHMEENGLDSIAGSEHKASYKAVTSSRIDTTALKRDLPEIAAKYTKTTNTRRFLFV